MQDHYCQVVHELFDSDIAKESPVILKVTSLSMTPFLHPGDRVFVQAIPIGFLRRGDLLATRRGDGFLTHRFLAVDANGWHTKGDRNNQADAPVDASEIIGIVVAIDRCGKLIGLNTPPRRLLARWHGWLGWLEIASNSSFGSRLLRGISRVSMNLSSLLFRP